MDLPFATLDVFTTTRLEGNPLAIVVVPPSHRQLLTQEKKQKITREFNLSETVFLHDLEDREQGDGKREIDIFTVEREVPFAGHPTIGTAVFVRGYYHELFPSSSPSSGEKAHVNTLVTKAGPIHLESIGGESISGIRAKIPHDVHLHSKTLGDVLVKYGVSPSSSAAEREQERQELVRFGLSSDATVRKAELEAPVFSIVRGMTFVLVRLGSVDQLSEKVQSISWLDWDKLPGDGRSALLDAGPWGDGFLCRYYFVDVDSDSDEDRDVRCIRTRMIELGFEDPATGSAATALAAYLTLYEGSNARKFRFTQGVEIGRKSIVSVETTTRDPVERGGRAKLEDVWLGGSAVLAMKGSLRVDV